MSEADGRAAVIWSQFYLSEEDPQQSWAKNSLVRVMKSQKYAVVLLAVTNLLLTVLLYRDGRYLVSSFEGLDWFDPAHSLRYRTTIYTFVGIVELYLAFAAFCIIR